MNYVVAKQNLSITDWDTTLLRVCARRLNALCAVAILGAATLLVPAEPLNCLHSPWRWPTQHQRLLGG
jgi:hypothetical protein